MKKLRFFFDRCCPVKLAKLVAVFDDDSDIRHFDDDERFEKDADDVDWIPVVAGDDPPWVIVSFDAKILKRPHEKQCLKDAGTHFFLFGDAWMHMPMEEKCWKLIKVWPDLVRTAREQRHRLYEVKAGSSLKIEAV